MSDEALLKFWPLLQSLVAEFWAVTEPQIEEVAIRSGIPIELYLYSELGLELFSTEEFQKRDPFSSPQQFEKIFVTLNVKGWIEPRQDGKYDVTERARQAARRLIQAGDARLLSFQPSAPLDLSRLVSLLRQIALANVEAPPPPEKWAVIKRFRTSGPASSPIVQAREALMDMLAYRDDCRLAAAHPFFGRAGIVWSVLGQLWQQSSVTAKQLEETHTFRGHEAGDYEVALQAAVEIGWAAETGRPGMYCITPLGRQVWDQAERQTDEYFFGPWPVLTPGEQEELYEQLAQLLAQLRVFRRSLQAP